MRPLPIRNRAMICAAALVTAGVLAAGLCAGAVSSAVQPPVAGSGDPAFVPAGALAHGRWSVLARSPLGARYGPVLAWDGQELLEVGGTSAGSSGAAPGASGAAYNPTLGRWRGLPLAPGVLKPAYAASVWTGQQLFVFGDASGAGHAELYNPATDSWSVTTRAPLGELEQPTAVWDGTAVILAGIQAGHLEVAGYNPAGNAWTRLRPPISARHESLGLAMVATSHGALLWSLWRRTHMTGNCFPGRCYGVDVLRLGHSGVWANVTGSWPQAHTVDGPIFTGSKILVAPGQIWCGACSHPAPFDEHGYIVNPTTLRITPIPHGPFDDLGPQILWTGAAEISFNAGGELTGPRVKVLPGDIAVWNPATSRWARGPRAPLAVDDAPAVWDGSRLFVLARNGRLLGYGPR